MRLTDLYNAPKKKKTGPQSFVNVIDIARTHRKKVIDVLEDWFSRYPNEHQDSLRNKFYCDWDYMPAYSELLVHELALRHNYSIEVEPDNTGGPDFRINTGKGEFYLEVTYCREPDVREESSNIKRKFLDLLRELKLNGHRFIFRDITVGPNDIDIEWIIDQLRSILQDKEASRTISHMDWEMKVEYGGENPGSPVLFYETDSRSKNISKSIENKIKDKIKRCYSDKHRPLVLAIVVGTISANENHVFEALFGKITYTIERDPATNTFANLSGKVDQNGIAFLDNGLDGRKTYGMQEFGAVLSLLKCGPSIAGTAEAFVVYHPDAQHPVSFEIFPRIKQYKTSKDEIMSGSDRESLFQILG